MITINIAVVAHMNRLDRAAELAKTVQANYITVDDGTLGCTQSHKLAWGWHRARNTPTTWAVTLEDDALAPTDLREQLEAALITSPAPIVSLYLGRQRPQEFQQAISKAITHADHNNASWIVGQDCIHAVGVAILQTHVADLHHDLHTPRLHQPPIDEAISLWARSRQYPVAYTYPSLIDHDDTIPPVAAHDGPRDPGRVAWQTGTREHWNSTYVTLESP